MQRKTISSDDIARTVASSSAIDIACVSTSEIYAALQNKTKKATLFKCLQHVKRI